MSQNKPKIIRYMKTKALLIVMTMLNTGIIMATAPNSATNTDTTRARAIIKQIEMSAILDGSADDPVWAVLDPVPIDRPFYANRPYSLDQPTLYGAFWKAFWNDTAFFILVQVVDDIFYPYWENGQEEPGDYIAIYMDVNGTKPEGFGPGYGSGVYQGQYQFLHRYDTLPFKGTMQPGRVDSTWTSNTWSYEDSATLTTEWCISFKALIDSANVPFNPYNTAQIGFDVEINDADSANGYLDKKQVWSNTVVSNWSNMDSAGIVKLIRCFGCTTGIEESSSSMPLINPTLVSTYINVPAEITKLEIMDILGRKALIANDNPGSVNISHFMPGVYFVRLFRNQEYLGYQQIIKY
jgi:hypothetical protein